MKTQWSDFLIQAETYGECMNCKGVTDMVSLNFNTYVCSGECEKELNNIIDKLNLKEM